MARSMSAVLFMVTLILGANAQFGFGGPGSGGGDGCPPWATNCDDSNGSDSGSSSSSGITQGSLFSNPAEFNRANRILIVHAVLASVVWVLFIPSLAILLRLNLKDPVVLKVHAIGQILSYVIYVVAAGLGIWLAQQTSSYATWDDAHPKLGLAILALAFFQPIFGAFHHTLYKKRSQNFQAGKTTKPAGRTTSGGLHVWLGRLLIVLAMINGGLGIRLASFSPFQTDSTSTKVKIAYGIIAATMFLLYLFFVIAFELKKARSGREELSRGQDEARNKDGLPTYDESEESIGRSMRLAPPEDI